MRPANVIQSALNAIADTVDDLLEQAVHLEDPEQLWAAAEELSAAGEALEWALGGTPDCRPLLAPCLGQSCEEPDRWEPQDSDN